MWTEKDREKYKDDGRRYPSDLTDVEWSIIEPLFRGYFTFTADMREVVNACFYLEHTGCPWRSLPSDFGPHQTVRTWYDRFRADGVWAQAGADLTRRVREAHGHGAEPTTGILDSQSVVSGPQPGERGFDGNKKIKGIKRHVLSCSLGFVLAVVVTPASVHDTKAAELVLDRAVENGFTIERAKVDAIYTGPTIEAVSGLYKVEFQVSTRETGVKGFAPLPLRWRIEATFGTATNRYRRLTRNLEQHAKGAEDAFELAHFRRVLRVYARDVPEIRENFEFERSCLTHLKSMSDSLARRGVDFVVVLLPLMPAWRDAYDPGGDRDAEFRSAVAEQLASTRTVLIDAQKGLRFRNEDFTDHAHLQWSSVPLLMQYLIAQLERTRLSYVGERNDLAAPDRTKW